MKKSRSSTRVQQVLMAICVSAALTGSMVAMSPARAATYLRTETVQYVHPVGLQICGVTYACLLLGGDEAFVSMSITDDTKPHAAAEYWIIKYNPALTGPPSFTLAYGTFCDSVQMVAIPPGADEMRITTDNLSAGTCPGLVNGLPFLDDGIKGTITATFFSAN